MKKTAAKKTATPAKKKVVTLKELKKRVSAPPRIRPPRPKKKDLAFPESPIAAPTLKAPAGTALKATPGDSMEEAEYVGRPKAFKTQPVSSLGLVPPAMKFFHLTEKQIAILVDNLPKQTFHNPYGQARKAFYSLVERRLIDREPGEGAFYYVLTAHGRALAELLTLLEEKGYADPSLL